MADVHPVLQYLIQSEFRDLEGAKIEGQLCLTDEAVNLGLGDVVSGLKAGGVSGGDADQGGSGSASPLPDPGVFTKKIRVSRLNYRTETGKTIVEIEAGIEK
ncbi:hypothetical protein [Lewinella sp. W8]|uniref:hypothetical protein n=1 Tax=Lewinella sp. W8 TaxID=2528208 RepID=UPI00106842B9|nr:hypothetical protein [Lewinella sp. W8]MTB52590.1 hypothetical protein [Lewinella sp. W8]